MKKGYPPDPLPKTFNVFGEDTYVFLRGHQTYKLAVLLQGSQISSPKNQKSLGGGLGEDLSSERSPPRVTNNVKVRAHSPRRRGEKRDRVYRRKKAGSFFSSLSPISYIIISRFFALCKGIRQFFVL
ncbi:MAG: hypothetical protein IJ561_01165 [Ruminococcus sp.]|nr:hypothetical protein [Ruminococcus sp.]